MIWHFVTPLIMAATLPALQQDTVLRVARAREQARVSSATIAAARAAVESAAGRERQSAAYPNPVLSYGREQTGAAESAQDIIALDQPVEVPGLRSARADAARLRRLAAEARLASAIAELDADVAARLATLVATQARAQLALNASAQFARASVTMRERLAAGDVSAYATRRVALEAARYAALAAETEALLTTNRTRLAELIRGRVWTAIAPQLLPLELPLDSVETRVASRHPAVLAARLEAEAAFADARVARMSVLGLPTLSGGLKTERSPGANGRSTGFVAGFAIPLPVWDRRGGAVAAAEADTRRLSAEADRLQHQVTAEAVALHAAVRRTDEQLAILRAQLGTEAQAALRAAETAYGEGEITLVEWLDAVRAYQEAEAAHANILADAIAQRAALERILGIRLIG